MFIGRYNLPLDSQNRIMIPRCFRGPFSDGAFVTQGFDRDLLLLTNGVFCKIFQRVKTMNMTDPLARLLIRMILGNATKLELNDTGYILVPQYLKEFANLENEVVLVGQGDYFEIWAPALWHKQELQLLDAEANANRFAMLDIATS